MPARDDLFAELFSSHQQRLFGYIFGIVRNSTDAQDILQQTAITLWKKFDDFDPDTDFARWAITVARFETLNFLKYRRRSRVYFDQGLMEQLEGDFLEIKTEVIQARREALKNCLSRLPSDDSKLIESRYSHGLGSRQISELLDRTQSSICNSLRRIRERLLRCVQQSTAREGL